MSCNLQEKVKIRRKKRLLLSSHEPQIYLVISLQGIAPLTDAHPHSDTHSLIQSQHLHTLTYYLGYKFCWWTELRCVSLLKQKRQKWLSLEHRTLRQTLTTHEWKHFHQVHQTVFQVGAVLYTRRRVQQPSGPSTPTITLLASQQEVIWGVITHAHLTGIQMQRPYIGENTQRRKPGDTQPHTY